MTHRHSSDGERATLTGRFVTRRTTLVDGRRVQRLRFERSDGGTVDVVVPADRFGAGIGLQTGARYRLSRACWCWPPGALAPPVDGPTACPDCGGRLRATGAVDRWLVGADQVVEAFDLDGPFLLVGGETAIGPVEGPDEFVRGSAGDATNGSARRHEDVTPSPSLVCTDCGRQFDADEVAGDHASSTSCGDR